MLVATACANPLEGRARWTLELLADAMVKLTGHESLSDETVRRRLAENGLKPWRKDMWCIPRVDGEYVARMEDVLDLYAETPDPDRPVVCFDESPVQMIGEVRQPIPAEPGQLERYDCEYRRNGTVNLFVCIDVHRPWRKIKVTERRVVGPSRPLRHGRLTDLGGLAKKLIRSRATVGPEREDQGRGMAASRKNHQHQNLAKPPTGCAMTAYECINEIRLNLGGGNLFRVSSG